MHYFYCTSTLLSQLLLRSIRKGQPVQNTITTKKRRHQALTHPEDLPQSLIKLAGIRPSLTKLAGMPLSLTKLAGMYLSLTKLAGMPQSLTKLAGMYLSLTKLAGMCPSLTKLAGMYLSLTKLAGMPLSLIQLAGLLQLLGLRGKKVNHSNRQSIHHLTHHCCVEGLVGTGL